MKMLYYKAWIETRGTGSISGIGVDCEVITGPASSNA